MIVPAQPRLLAPLPDLVVLLDVPELTAAQLELRVSLRLVPVDLIVDLVRFRGVVDDETLVVFSALVHDLAELFERFEHPCIVFVQTFSIRHVRFSQEKDEIDVGTELWRQAERELHRQQKEELMVSAVEKHLFDVSVADPHLGIEHEIVKDDERTRIYLFARIYLVLHQDLSPHDVGDDFRVEVVVNEHLGHHLVVKAVCGFRARNDGTHGDRAVMIEEISYQKGLARVALADEADDAVVGNSTHVELLKVHLALSWRHLITTLLC